MGFSRPGTKDGLGTFRTPFSAHRYKDIQMELSHVTLAQRGEALTIDVAGSIRSAHAIESLVKLIGVHGAPHALKSDNGPEFVSRAILRWLTCAGIDCVLSDPGKPWQNGHDESFNGKFRDECLSMEWFRNRHEAVPIIEAWRRHYSEVRPHSSLDYQTPIEFKTGTIKKTTQPLEADSQ